MTESHLAILAVHPLRESTKLSMLSMVFYAPRSDPELRAGSLPVVSNRRHIMSILTDNSVSR